MKILQQLYDTLADTYVQDDGTICHTSGGSMAYLTSFFFFFETSVYSLLFQRIYGHPDRPNSVPLIFIFAVF